MNEVVKAETIAGKIYQIRRVQVMVDTDLADLYRVPAKRSNEQVKRNIDRFPLEFQFQLTNEEFENLKTEYGASSLRSQNATLEKGCGKHRKYLSDFRRKRGLPSGSIAQGSRGKMVRLLEN